MAAILATGYALATAPLVHRLLDRITASVRLRHRSRARRVGGREHVRVPREQQPCISELIGLLAAIYAVRYLSAVVRWT